MNNSKDFKKNSQKVPHHPSKAVPFDSENRLGYFQTHDNCKSIYIGNLVYKMDKISIAKLFKPFGKVKYVKVVVDPKTDVSKGIAFVQMSSPQETAKAISELNATTVNGRTIKVSLATRQDNFARNKPRKIVDIATGKVTKEPQDQAKIPEPQLRRRDKKRGIKQLFDYLEG